MGSISPVTLRKRRASFLEGFAELFSDVPLSDSFRTSPSADIADARALAEDFRLTGDDLRGAFSSYART